MGLSAHCPLCGYTAAAFDIRDAMKALEEHKCSGPWDTNP